MLSRMQSQWVADALEKRHPGLTIELVLCKTTGDVLVDKPLHDAGGKGLFTKELEQALLRRDVDFAVHSYKDVPVTMPLVERAQDDLIIVAVPKREDPRDVLISAKARRLSDLPQAAKVGTGSLRRGAQIRAIRPDLQIQLIRGNIDTRLRKLRAGQFDAVILAMAGLKRTALFDDQDMTVIDADEMLPAAGQGALALQCRRDDANTRQLLAAIHSPTDAACVDLERCVVQALNGDCHSPIAALATVEGDQITLRTAVAGRDGQPPVIKAGASGTVSDTAEILNRVVADLEKQDVHHLLHGNGRPIDP
jgi:hydroxymethylbilane synthase